MKHFRQSAALLLSAILCCSAVALSGCGDTSSNAGDDTLSAYSPVVPDSKIDENEPGEIVDATVGTPLNYQDKLDVTLTKIIELDAGNNTERRILLAEFTIKNKTDTAVDCSTLTHFSASVDGTVKKGIVSQTTAAILARKYYTKLGSDMQSLNQAIEPGTSISGYVYMEVPSSWDELKLIYKPYKYYSNDTIEFPIVESELEHYTEPLS